MPAEPDTPILTDNQRRVVGFALTLLALVGSAALLIAALIAFGRLIGFFSNVLWPLAVGGVMALILRPVVQVLERRLHVRRFAAVILLYVVFVMLVAGILLLLIPLLVEQIVGLISFIPELWEKAWGYVQEHYPQWVDLAHRQLANPSIQRMTDSIAGEAKALLAKALPTLGVAFGGIFDVFAFITHVGIIPVYLFFFLLIRGEPTRNLGNHLPFLSAHVRKDVVFLASEFISIIESFFRGQLLIGVCMGVLYAIGFTVIGLKFGLFLGLLIGLLNVVPYLGSILGLAIALPLAFFQPEGGWQLAGFVLLVKIVVQCVESWVLTPRIMGHQTGLHPLMIIVAIFFWGTAFGGILGMLLAVPLTAFFVTAWRLAKRKYLYVPNA